MQSFWEWGGTPALYEDSGFTLNLGQKGRNTPLPFGQGFALSLTRAAGGGFVRIRGRSEETERNRLGGATRMNRLRRIPLRFRYPLSLTLTVAVLLAIAPTAVAVAVPDDEITVKDTTLKGRILGFEKDGIRFRTIYGKGTITIAYTDVQHMQAHGEYHIFHGEQQEVEGRILGVEDGRLLVGDDPATAEQVASGTIRKGVSKVEHEEESWIERLRNRYPHWRANLDLGFRVEDGGGVDKRRIDWGFNIERRKKPTRFVARWLQAFEREREVGEPAATTTDEFHGFLLGEYDLSKRFFLFALPAVDRDVPRGIDIRAYPGAGVGYRFVETQQAHLQAQVGGAYVYEDFTDFGDNTYASGLLGLEGRYEFESGISVYGRMFYYPGLSDPSKEWLYRTEFALTVPLIDPIAMKLRVTNINDSNPTPDIGNNKVTTTLGLSLIF